jgi:NAD+ kinase
MLITPICPHILYSRSFIAPDSRTVMIRIDECCEVDAMVAADGQKGFSLMPGDQVRVRAANNDALFASITDVNFYEVLRAKIHQ